jgi:hypothetical protein
VIVALSPRCWASRAAHVQQGKRARAYGFPAEAYSNRNGRPTISANDTGGDTETNPDTTPTSDRASAGEPTGDADGDDDGTGESIAGRDAQQRLDAVEGDVGDATPERTSAATEASRDVTGKADADVDEAVREAIAALEAVVDALEEEGPRGDAGVIEAVRREGGFGGSGGRELFSVDLYSVEDVSRTRPGLSQRLWRHISREKRATVPKEFENVDERVCLRLPAKAVALTIALLVVAQFFAVVIESQRAALLSWYLIYALIILIPVTLVYEGVTRLYPHTPS